MFNFRLFGTKKFKLVYDGEDTTPAGGGNDTLQGGNSNSDNKITFTAEQQKFFNESMAKERRKLQEQNTKTIAELQKLQQSSSITQKEKEQLNSRIEELQTQFLSKEELLKKENEKVRKEKQDELQKVSKERDFWRGEFAVSTVHRSLVDAAVTHEAFNPEQVVAILKPHTRLVPIVVEGKQTGKLTTMVKMQDVDTEGKPIILDLTVTDAVKRMKDLPERFGNLFKSGIAGGLGQTSGTQSKKVDVAKMSAQQYKEWRKTGLKNKPT